MLGRREWFDAGPKGMVRCWIEGNGSMLGPRIGSLWGFIGNWTPKTNLAGTKNWRPNKNYFGKNKYYEYGNNK